MKFRFRMPEEAVKNLLKFISLPKERKDKYIFLINSILPVFTKETIKDLPDLSKEEKKDFLDFLNMFISLYINFYNSGQIIDDFIDDVIIRSIRKEDKDFQISDDLKFYIEKILEMEATLGIYAKNVFLSDENQNIFFESRIITDIRHVFYNDVLKLPDFAFVQHKLKIIYLESKGIKEKFFTLDLKDLIDLKNLIERAISKEKTLEKLSKRNNIKLLKEVEWSE